MSTLRLTVSWGIPIFAIAGVLAALAFVAVTPAAPGDLRPPRTLAFAATIIVYALAGALIVAGRPANPIGWLLCWTAFVAGAQNLAAGLGAFLVFGRGAPEGELVAWVFMWIGALFLGPGATLLLLLFPDGRPPSPRWWPVALVSLVASAAFGVGTALLPRIPIFDIANPFAPLEGASTVLDLVAVSLSTLLVCAFACAVSLVARMRRARGIERQQLKWFAYAGALAVAITTVAIASGLSLVILTVVVMLAFTLLPLAAAVAILRYRLYDIDVLINRTLVYGALSALLAATYFGAVVVLSALLRPFAAESELAVAGSTLAVVILFAPLRSRIQRLVDERFYRSKYDAARTLDAFAARLRDQVDLDALEREVLGVVGRTVQPAHAALWLRERPR